MTFGTLLYECAFDFSAMLLIITCLTYTFLQRHTGRPQNRLYIMSLINILATAVCNIVMKAVEPYEATVYRARIFSEVANYLYFILHAALGFMLFYYALLATHTFDHTSRMGHLMLITPFVLVEALVLFNPYTHAVYSFTKNHTFNRESGELLIYFLAFFYTVLTIYLFFGKWRSSNPRRRRILIFSYFCGIVGILCQALISALQTELLGESITMFGLMLAVEYDEERIDPMTGINNRNAFLNDMSTYFDARAELSILCIRLTNLDIAKRLFNYINEDHLVCLVTDYIKAFHPSFMTYRVGVGSLALIFLNDREGEKDILAQRISAKIREGFVLNGKNVVLQGVILTASTGAQLDSVEDVLLMCESPVPPSENGKILKDEDLQYLYYHAKLEHVLRRALQNRSFQVYYQPVYTKGRHIMRSAEASIRLHDLDLGELYPVDFISTAERIGIIDRLGEYVIREVCDFISSGEPEGMGLEFISIGLSVIQCMQPNFVEDTLAVVREFRVKPSMINFQISESAASNDYEILKGVIKTLKAEGFRFTLTEYGTGNANLYSIFSLDFDIMRIDKSLLDETSRSEKGWIVVENAIHMIHEQKRRVIVSGIETADQIQRTRELMVDWIEGPYFSHPMRRDDLIEIYG